MAIEMKCSKCHTKGHNKRRCLREPIIAVPSANTAVGPSSHSTASPSTSVVAGPTPKNVAAITIPKSRSATAPTGRGKGRPKGSIEKNVDTSRPRMVGMGVLHTHSGQTIINIKFLPFKYYFLKFKATNN